MNSKSRASVWRLVFLLLALPVMLCWLVACGGVPPTKLPVVAAWTPTSVPDADQARLRAAAEATIASARNTIEASRITPVHTLIAMPTATVRPTEQSTVPPIPTRQPRPTENTLNRPMNWTVPQRLGRTVGVTRQLLLDRSGRLWAVWEEHPGLDPQSPPTATRYCIWDGEQWGAMESIPGSDNMTETAATMLNDGSILVMGQRWGGAQKSGTPPTGSPTWFRWDVAKGWLSMPEMALTIPTRSAGVSTIAMDGNGQVHLIANTIVTWDGKAWRQTGRLDVACLSKAVMGADGNLHVIGEERNRKVIRHWAWDGQVWSDRGTVYVQPEDPLRSIGAPPWRLIPTAHRMPSGATRSRQRVA